ncbi:hypothetical protein EIP91_001957 [Steccherinum ochraceum]|uniref:Uncharacterized protein n=1 Tax=Steccherinum ochraceum TaxID=92696 RepID=A0A4R0RJA8_9APHY|nr:hypothetical protein EIP91_001957 [Steccherinum ochraceum]
MCPLLHSSSTISPGSFTPNFASLGLFSFSHRTALAMAPDDIAISSTDNKSVTEIGFSIVVSYIAAAAQQPSDAQDRGHATQHRQSHEDFFLRLNGSPKPTGLMTRSYRTCMHPLHKAIELGVSFLATVH